MTRGAMFGLCLLGAAALPAQTSGVISGTVRSATSRLPLEGAQVSLIGEESTGAQTDVRGAFLFAGLPKGSYTLRVEKPSYSEPDPLKVDMGAEPVIVDMYPLAQIEGRVLDEDGNPASGVTVEPAFPPFLKGMPWMRGATSEKNGHFVLPNLGPRDYVIRLWIPAALRARGYPAMEFYPGVTDAARAAAIQVAEGAQMAGFDLRLRRVPLVTFRGHMVDLSGNEAARVVAVALDWEPALIEGNYARRPVDVEGRFHFDGVPPGRHVLQVYRGTGSDDLPHAATVDVGKDDVPVPVPPFANLEGMVRSTTSVAWQGVLGIGLGTDGAWRRNVLPDKDGAFTLPDVPPGDWRLRVESNDLQAAGRTLRVSAAQFGAADVLDQPMIVTESGNPPIAITISDESGRIAGTVEEEEPADAVIVMAQRLEQLKLPLSSAEAKPDGSFLIGELLPGDYRVMAWGLTVARLGVEGTDCAKRAQKVTVINGQTAMVRLKRCDR